MVLKPILEIAALTQSRPKIDTKLAIKVGVSRPDRAQALIIKAEVMSPNARIITLTSFPPAKAEPVDLSLDPFELVGFSRNGALAKEDMTSRFLQPA